MDDDSNKDDSIPEVIITASNECNIYNPQNGNCIAAYKDSAVKVSILMPKTLSLIGQDFLIGACSNKPCLKVWKLNKEGEKGARDFFVPGIVTALAVSKCGKFCIGGIKEKIYIWDVSTGIILNVLGRHYQSVTCLKFTPDDACFLSAGKDGHVIVWDLSSAIDVHAYLQNVMPQFVWTHHSSEVTDVYCGYRVATTSLDMTCKIYELDSGILLSSICTDVPLTAVTMDLLEHVILLADEQGYVYKIHTYERLPHEIHRTDANVKVAIRLHETKIYSLNVSFDGTHFVTASEDGYCKVFEIQSMAGICSIRSPGATNAFLALQPACLTNNGVKPQLSYKPFSKDLSEKAENKYVEVTTNFKELSIMYDGCPDGTYGHSIFCSKPGVKLDNENAAAAHDMFQHNIHSGTVSDLTEVNQGIFTVAVKQNMAHFFQGPPSPS